MVPSEVLQFWLEVYLFAIDGAEVYGYIWIIVEAFRRVMVLHGITVTDFKRKRTRVDYVHGGVTDCAFVRVYWGVLELRLGYSELRFVHVGLRVLVPAGLGLVGV